jgi:PhnB protein
MATTTMPGGKSTVTPYVAAKGAATFLDFVEQAFDTDTALRVLNQDGTIGHAEVRIGDSVIMAFDAQPDWPDTPSFLSVYVDDVDAVVARALAAGAVIVTEVATSRIVGDRGGRIQIRSGTSGGSRHTWKTSTRPPCASCSLIPRRPPRCNACRIRSPPRCDVELTPALLSVPIMTRRS